MAGRTRSCNTPESLASVLLHCVTVRTFAQASLSALSKPSPKRTCSTSVPSAPFASAMRSGEDGSGAPVGATRLVREGREVRKALLRLKGGGGRGGRGIFPPPDEEPDIERSQR